MRVVLAAAPTPGNRHRQAENLGLRYLAATARHAGHDVAILEATDAPIDVDTFVSAISKSRPDVVGFAVQFANQAHPTAAAASKLASVEPKAGIVVGGQAVNFAWEDLLDLAPEIHAAACFEADETFPAFLKWWSAGRRGDAPRGYYLRDGTAITSTGFAEPVADLDALPFPARDLESRVYGDPNFVVLTSRGCQSSCTFCSSGFFGNRYHRQSRWRPRSVASVTAELFQLASRDGARAVSFVDDDFLGGKASDPAGRDRASELAAAMHAERLRLAFSIELRADETVAAHRELTDLTAVGLSHVLIGIDALTQRDLKLYSKRITFDLVRDAVQTVAALGLTASYGAILFNPRTQLTDLREGLATLDYLGIAKSDHLTNVLQLYRGSPLVPLLSRQCTSLAWDPVAFRYTYDLGDEVRTVHEAFKRLASAVKGHEIVLAKARFRVSTGLACVPSEWSTRAARLETRLSQEVCAEAHRLIDHPDRDIHSAISSVLAEVDRLAGPVAKASPQK